MRQASKGPTPVRNKSSKPIGIFTLLKNGVPTLIRSPVNHSEKTGKSVPDSTAMQDTNIAYWRYAALEEPVVLGKMYQAADKVYIELQRARSEVKDPQHKLLSGMFATFVIRTGDPVRSAAVPLDGVVREGDGTMTVWVTADRRRFTKRTVKIGLQHEGYRQILEGLQPGELVATEGAIFLSNMLTIALSQ